VKVRLTQIDGALPNIAIMKLASWHLEHGDEIKVTRHIDPQPDEVPDLFQRGYDRVYGSVLFDFSRDRLERFRKAWPGAIVGGTGAGAEQLGFSVESFLGQRYDYVDYEGYPDFDHSIGFTQRGCRLKCKFCVVPRKEGKPVSVGTINDVWRGEGYPKKLHILDNDFFGQPRADWEARVREMIDGDFKICLSQGINVRLIDDAAAATLAMIPYRNTKFDRRRLYTAWDNIGDEKVFFRGIDRLERAGIPSGHIMAYMLVGYDKAETWDRLWHRFNAMKDRGILPYPMVFDRTRKDLLRFQRWVVTGLYRAVPWEEYDVSIKRAAA
jgi:hypothetical protein